MGGEGDVLQHDQTVGQGYPSQQEIDWITSENYLHNLEILECLVQRSGALKVSKMAEEQFQLFEEIDIFLFLRGFTRENINVFRKIFNKQQNGANHSYHS